jgi:hypothetical protein
MTGRVKIFDDGEPVADLGRFAPKSSTPTNPPAEVIQRAAEAGGFPSRSAKSSRDRTGRTALLGVRITQRAYDRLHEIAEEEIARFEAGELGHRPTLGEIVERALALLDGRKL